MKTILRRLLWCAASVLALGMLTIGPEPRIAHAQVTFCSNNLASATTASAVTPSDTTIFAPPARALYVGSAGDLKVRMAADQGDVTFTAVPGGSVMPICIDMVYATGTTATAIALMR